MASQHRKPPSGAGELRPLPKPVRSKAPARPGQPVKTAPRKRPANTPMPTPTRQSQPINPDDFEVPVRRTRTPNRASNTHRPQEPTLGEALQIFARRQLRRYHGQHKRSYRSSPQGQQNRQRQYKQSNPRIMFYLGAGALALVFISLVTLLIWSATNKNAYAVYLNDKLTGYIAIAKDVEETAIQSQAVGLLEASIGARVQANETVTIKPVHASRKDISPYSDLIDRISRGFSYKIAATAIYVEDRKIAVLKTIEEAKSVAEQLQAPFVKEDIYYPVIDFVEKWEYVTTLVDQEELNTKEDALLQLDKKTRAMVDYVIAGGDMLGTIAVRNNTTIDKICSDNPGLTAATVLKVGQVIKLETTKPYLSVKTVEETTRKESVPMPVKNVENAAEYKTYTKVLQEGQNGEQEITIRTTRINGIQTEPEQIISTKTTIEPVERVVEIGTSETTPQRH